MLDECGQVAVTNKVMIKVVAGKVLKLNDEGKHCKDDLVNGDVEVHV